MIEEENVWVKVPQKLKIEIPSDYEGPIQQLLPLLLVREEESLGIINQLESQIEEIRLENRDIKKRLEILDPEKAKQQRNQTQHLSPLQDIQYFGSTEFGQSQQMHYYVCHQCHHDIVAQKNKELPLISQFSHQSKMSELMKGVSQEFDHYDDNVHTITLPINEKSEKECLDFAFLFSDPLMIEDSFNKLYPMKEPLDVGTEFREIQKYISRHSSKKFTMRKEVATYETLKTILLKRPKIIHISCHGDQDANQFYLALEHKDTGILDKVTESRFKNLLEEEKDHSVKLAFVSACHSEKIGQIFLNSQIPVVISVNSQQKILDSVCQIFARHFYLYLLEGQTPKEAFEYSKNVVAASGNKDFSVCCCAHPHKEDCNWMKYAEMKGLEQAHQLHYISSCSCQLPWNKHYERCKQANNYIKEMIRFTEDELKEEFSEFVLNLHNYDDSSTGIVKIINLCCCSHESKHDESIKFTIKGDPEFQNTPIFTRTQQGSVIVQSDINENNRLPSNIDSLELVGRNKELQILVQIFSSENEPNLIHIYGEGGIGKTNIAKYAAKYTMDRRQFQDGIFYIDASNRYQAQGLFQKLCAKMQIFVEKKAQFVHLIKQKSILIIVDNTNNLLEQDRARFNKLIQYLVVNCDYLKLVLVTRKEEDIDNIPQKFSLKIKCLSKEDAIQLLLLAGRNSKYLRNKNAQDLFTHPILNMVAPYKPTTIVQLAAYLNHKSLDEILEEKERMSKQEVQNASRLNDQREMEYREFYWILSLQFNKLRQSYEQEFNLLYFLCQTPFGITMTDVECITQQNPKLYGNWKAFLDQICKIESLPQQEDVENDQKSQHFMIASSNYIKELKEQHFVAPQMVIEYVNTMILNREQKLFVFKETLLFMSVLSRQLLRCIKLKEKKMLDIQVLSNEIDRGMWTREIISPSLFPFLKEIYNPVIKFNYNESNFYSFVEANQLQDYFNTPQEDQAEIEKNLDELICNTLSIFILLNRLKESKKFIEKVSKLTKQLKQLRYLQAKVELIECSIQIKVGYQGIPLILNNIEQAYKTFHDMRHFEAEGEAKYLKGLAYIQQYHNVCFEEESHLSLMTQANFFSQNQIDRDQIQGIKSQGSDGTTHKVSPQTHSKNLMAGGRYESQAEKKKNYIKEKVYFELKQADRLFKKTGIEFNLAKLQLIQAEFEFSLLEREILHDDSQYIQIKNKLLGAKKIFEQVQKPNLKGRCLRNLALLYKWNSEVYEAKSVLNEAIQIFRSLNNANSEAQVLSDLNDILDLIRMETKNLFIFAKSFPLIEYDHKQNKSSEIQNGTITRHPYEFRKIIKEEISKLGKKVKVKFEILQLSHLNYIKKYGCRVLQLTSDVHQKDYLCMEGEFGQIRRVHIKDLKNILKTKKNQLNIDLVILAIPNSVTIGQVFIELGVPYVIAFDFNDTILGTLMDSIYLYPKILEIIQLFSIEFCKNLVKEMTIEESLTMAKTELTKNVELLKQQYEKNQGETLKIGKGPILMSQKNVHIDEDRLFGVEQFLYDGELIDTSSVRAPNNIKKVYKPFTGRFKQSFFTISSLAKHFIRIINVYGSTGIGKTRFVSEIAYWENCRQKFIDGTFLLDLKDSVSLEQLKVQLNDINLESEGLDYNSQLNNKNLLLILDDVDMIVKHSKNQFQWWLETVLSLSPKLKIIFTSKKKIDLKELPKMNKRTRSILLPPFNDIETVDMLLTNCKKQIAPDELYLHQHQRKQIHKQLLNETNIAKCMGRPKYILKLAEKLEEKDFNQIYINQKSLHSLMEEKKNDSGIDSENENFNDKVILEFPASREVSCVSMADEKSSALVEGGSLPKVNTALLNKLGVTLTQRVQIPKFEINEPAPNQSEKQRQKEMKKQNQFQMKVDNEETKFNKQNFKVSKSKSFKSPKPVLLKRQHSDKNIERLGQIRDFNPYFNRKRNSQNQSSDKKQEYKEKKISKAFRQKQGHLLKVSSLNDLTSYQDNDLE